MKNLRFFTAIIVVFFLLMSLATFAQEVTDQDLFRGAVFKSFDLGEDDIKGTPYIDEEFMPAKINDGKILYFMRYDAYSNQMEAQQEDGVYLVPKTYNLPIQFTTSNKTYQLFDYMLSGEFITEFFVVLNQGKHKLLALEDVKFYAGEKTNSTLKKDTPPSLKRSMDAMYMTIDNKNAIELPKKKKDFLIVFKEDAKKVSDFMKKEKLGNKSKEDLIQIFEYYNSL